MRSTGSLLRLVASVVFTTGAAARAADPPPKPPEPTGTLSGTVVGPDGKPVPGAHVWLGRHTEKPHAEATAGADGRFRLGPVPAAPARYRDLFAEADGLARTYVREPAVFADRDHDLGEVRLAKGRRLTGAVIDHDGKPLARSKVAVVLSRNYMGHTTINLSLPLEVETDSGGRYETPPLPVCEAMVRVSVPGREIGYVVERVTPGPVKELKAIRLKKDVPVVFTVRDQDGKPVEGAELRGLWVTAKSDKDGQLVVRGVGDPPPAVAGRVSKEGYAEDVAALNAKGEKDRTVVLKKAGHIVGTAVDADTGKPVRVENIQLCQFERRPDGEIVRRG